MDTESRAAQLRGYLAADPRNADLACALLDALIAEGRGGEAAATVASWPVPVAATSGVRFRLARAALVTGDYAAAESILSAVLDEGVDGIALRHDLAFVQLCQRRADEAAATVRAAIEAFGADVDLLVLGARVETMREAPAAAVALLDQALAIAPDHAQALGLRALALFDAGDMDAAHAAAVDCLARDPDQHEALLVAATQALWRGDVVASGAYVSRALQRHPDSGRALSVQGQLAMAGGDLPAAAEILARATVAMPDHIGTWHALAWVQLLSGEVDAAATSYEAAFAIDRDFGDSHGGLALVAALRDDAPAAREHLKRALRLAPDGATARYAEIVLLDAAGDHDAAEARFRALAAGTPAAATPLAEFLGRFRSRTAIRA